MENEIWKDIRGFEGEYQVSSMGRVKSLYRVYESRPGVRYTRQERILKHSTSNRYPTVVLRKSIHVHRLVAETFIPNPENKGEVNHINGIKNDNRLENLEWTTRGENMDHARNVLGKNQRGSKNGNSVLTENDVLDIRALISFGAKLSDIRTAYGLKWAHVSLINNRRCWAHI